MTTELFEVEGSRFNPLDLIEEMINANGWSCDRFESDQLFAAVAGRWCDYRLYFSWAEDLSALRFCGALDIKVPSGQMAPLYELLALVNEKMWLGHFDLSPGDMAPTFRHTLLLRGARGISAEQVEDLVDIGLAECERFYPAFQFLIWGGKSAADAIAAAVLDPVGEA